MFKEISQLYHDLDGGLTALSIFFPNAPIPAHLYVCRPHDVFQPPHGTVVHKRTSLPSCKMIHRTIVSAHSTRNRARREMVKLFKSIIDERRAKGEVRNDVLQRFMDAEYKDGKQCTVEEVTGLMIALLFAGQHTSSITSTWTTRFLMEHPDLMYVGLPAALPFAEYTTYTRPPSHMYSYPVCCACVYEKIWARAGSEHALSKMKC